MFKLACDTNNIHGRAAVWILRHCVEKILAIAFNSQLCAGDRLSQFTASVRDECTRSGNISHSYPEVVHNLLKKYVCHQAIAETDTAIQLYVQPRNSMWMIWSRKLATLLTYTTKLGSTTCSSKVFTHPLGRPYIIIGQRTHKQTYQKSCSWQNRFYKFRKDLGKFKEATTQTPIWQNHIAVNYVKVAI